MKTSLIAFNKPFGVISQFSSHDKHIKLKKYITEAGFYPAGRLDTDSEGLLLLTNDGQLQAKITEPKFKLAKSYFVQVDGDITNPAICQLSLGVQLRDFKTAPGKICRRQPPKELWPRFPPIRERKNICTSWIHITINEGKNRQIRHMCAAVGFPCLRLIRIQIGRFNLFKAGLVLGEWQYIQPGQL